MEKNKQNFNEISTFLFKEYSDCVGVNDLQKMLGIKRTKTYELLQSGEIKSIKIGKDYRISKFMQLLITKIIMEDINKNGFLPN